MLAVPTLARPALAEEEEGDGVPSADLVLRIRDASGDTVAKVRLECDPGGGTHPTAEAACLALDEVDGDFGELPETGAQCSDEYEPVAARADGRWKDRRVRFRRRFPNRCAAEAGTADVFRF